jgi:hypothetical protein
MCLREPDSVPWHGGSSYRTLRLFDIFGHEATTAHNFQQHFETHFAGLAILFFGGAAALA